MPPARRKRTAELLITPSATLPVASEMSPDSAEGGQNSGGRRYNCPIEGYLMTLNPDHSPTPEDLLVKVVRSLGGTDNIEDVWESYVKRANEVVDKLKSKPAVAEKPKEGDTSVMYYDIPDSNNFAIRLWDGNMQERGLYCFDLYDTSKGTAVNLPSNYKICNAPHAGAFVVGGAGLEVKSWEFAWGVPPEKIPPGEERFAVPEGSHLALVRPGKPLFCFALPTRPRVYGGVGAIFAQPRR